MYSLVIPVYKNEDSIAPLLESIKGIHQRLSQPLEVVFVLDGNPDRSLQRLTELLPNFTFHARLIILSRNFGSFAAIRAGLQKATGQYFAVMAADLQEPSELIDSFFDILSRDEADVIVGTRSARNDPLVSRVASQLFWLFYRKFIQTETPPGGVDIFGCNDLFRRQLLALDESHSSLVGLLLWLGFRRKEIPYVRRKRPHGKSGWTFWKKVHYVSDSAFSFSNSPIQALFWMGLFGLLTSAVFSVIVVWARLSGQIVVPGYSPIVLAIVFFGSLNLVCLGIVGSYVWRTFENTKCRPGAIVMREIELK
jgi:glycosyltransferase involved in cell wall biosynthesis